MVDELTVSILSVFQQFVILLEKLISTYKVRMFTE